MRCEECAVTKQALAEEKAARRYAETLLKQRVGQRDERIAALEAEVARYRALFAAADED